jgi:recombination protein RecA
MAGSRELAAFAAKMHVKYKEPPKPPTVIVPTGILSLDWALRVGGWQLGRIYEIVGPKDSGKSLTTIKAMVSHRQMFPDRGVAYVNIEGTFDEPWATLNGLDCSKAATKAGTWAELPARTSEEASDKARDYVGSGLYSCLVIDSVGAMESAKVLGVEAIKDTMGKNAGVITKLTKALAGLAKDNQCTILLVNQPRANMSGFGGDISAGPKAMQHSTTAQIKMSGLNGEKDVRTAEYFGDTERVGGRFRASVPRMKNGAPGRRADWFIMNRETPQFGPAGVDLADDVLSLGVRLGVIEQGGGGYYTLPAGDKLKGRPAVGAFLREHPEAMKAIREAFQFDTPIIDPTDPEEGST